MGDPYVTDTNFNINRSSGNTINHKVGADGITEAGKNRIRWEHPVIYTYTIVYKCDYFIVCYVYLAEECV